MGDYKNLSDKEGIDKLKELVKSADICMFASHADADTLSARPMSTQDVDDDGILWFFSQASSNKNAELEADNRVQLFYANKNSSEYLSISGKATILKDEQKAKELWTGWVKTWFTEGPNDPELTIIKVEPGDAYYWDTKHNKMVSLVKIMAGAIIGKTMDDSVEGHITV
ncbi:MAG: pyridoxamine 5'-phosphate oxidase family protein [Ferruginibacter sp.]|nr:pyridoxamine 5'-phosphate oxidase family protein [Ferruginibacter sp.]